MTMNDTLDILEVNDGRSTVIDELDPDKNVLEEVINCNCKYYDENTFNDMIDGMVKDQTKLSLLHLNVRSLPKNFDAFNEYLQCIKHQFSVIGLSETWHTDASCDLYSLLGYECISRNRINRRGGGVALYINNAIQCKERPDLCIFNDYVECVFVEISFHCSGKSQNAVVGILYRPPNTSMAEFNDNCMNIFDVLKTERKPCYIMGDFNINLFNYESHSDTTDFLNLMFSHCFFPAISKPTRVTEYSSTLIDNIFSNSPQHLNSSINGILCTDISDHFPVFSIINNNVDSADQSFPCRSITFKGKQKFRKLVSEIDWNLVVNESDASRAFQKMHSMIQTAYHKAFPIRKGTSKTRGHKPWLTDALKTSINTKNKLYIKYRRISTLLNKTNYLNYKRILTNILRKAERKYYHEKLMAYKHDLKISWKILKDLIGLKRPDTINTEFKIDGHLESDKVKIVNEFNKCFVNLGPSLASTIPQTHAVSHKFYMKPSTLRVCFLSPLPLLKYQMCLVILKTVVRAGMRSKLLFLRKSMIN